MIVMLIGHVGSILLELRKMNGGCGCLLSAGLWHHSVEQPRKVTLPQVLCPLPTSPAVSASCCGDQGPLRTKGAIYWGRASWPNMDSRSMDGKWA